VLFSVPLCYIKFYCFLLLSSQAHVIYYVIY